MNTRTHAEKLKITMQKSPSKLQQYKLSIISLITTDHSHKCSCSSCKHKKAKHKGCYTSHEKHEPIKHLATGQLRLHDPLTDQETRLMLRPLV